MKTNKKGMQFVAFGLILMGSNLLFLHRFLELSDFWFGLLQGASIGLMIFGLGKMKKEKNGREKVEGSEF